MDILLYNSFEVKISDNVVKYLFSKFISFSLIFSLDFSFLDSFCITSFFNVLSLLCEFIVFKLIFKTSCSLFSSFSLLLLILVPIMLLISSLFLSSLFFGMVWF